MPVDNINSGADEDQPHDVIMGSQDNNILELGFYMDHQYSPELEPGPSRVSKYGQVFNVGPQSEAESEGDAEEGDTDQDDDTYVWFLPDTVPDSEDADEDMDEDDIIRAACFEDLRVLLGEESHQLDVERQLDNLGSSVLSTMASDNIKAMALKFGNQLTRNAFKGVQKLTRGHMAIGSEYVGSLSGACIGSKSPGL